MASSDSFKWLLGDWEGPLRDPLDLARLSFLLGAAVVATTGDLNNALRLFLTFLLVLAARQLDLPRLFDLVFLIGMAMQAWGNALSLFEGPDWYDKSVHFVLPLAAAPVLYILLIRLDAVPDLSEETRSHHYLAIGLITVSLGLAFGALYELYEWVAVHALGAHLEIGYEDTMTDLADDLVGSAAGAMLLVIWARFGWATSRRVPGRTARRMI